MKFIVDSGILLNALQVANKAISNSVIDILSNFKFEVKSGLLSVSASNMKVYITKTVNVEATEDFEICVPAKILTLVKDLPGQLLTLNFSDGLMEINSFNGRYQFATEDVINFPTFKEAFDKEVVLKSADLMEGFYKTAFACGNDELRPAMMCVFLEFDKGKLTFTGVNGFVLSTQSVTTNNDIRDSVLIPVNVIKILESVDLEEDITLSLRRNNIQFKVDDTLVIKSVISTESFPDYKMVIPTGNSNVLKVNTKQLLSAIKRVAGLSNLINKKVTLVLNENVKVTSENIDYKQLAEEKLGFEYEGIPMHINFTGNFMIDVLSKITDEIIYFGMSTSNRAIVIREDKDFSGKEDLFIVMPIMD